MVDLRHQVAKDLWRMTSEMAVLKEDAWKKGTGHRMKEFELSLIKYMR